MVIFLEKKEEEKKRFWPEGSEEASRRGRRQGKRVKEGNINPLKNVSCLTQRQMIKNSSTPALVPAVIGNWLCVHNNAIPTFFYQ